MSNPEHQLSTLLGSRICHDLISPLGAIGNGLELLSMTGGSNQGAELNLISESVESANARLKFFRVAFGAASADPTDPGAPMAPTEVRDILKAYVNSARVSIDWQIDQGIPRAMVRAAFLLIQCMETALPFGGAVTISPSAKDRWMVEARAEKVKVNMALWEHLSHPAAKHVLTPAEVHFGLLRPALSALGRQLRLEISESIGIRAEF